MAVTFDTLAYAKRLRGAGLSEEQAAVHAEALATALGEVLVTKQDLRELATKDDVHRLELATNAEFAAVRQEMTAGFAELRQEMTAGLGDLRQEMVARFAAVDREFAALRQEMRSLETRMTLRLGALLSIGIGALAAVTRL
ncbi:MAG: hypothetical protein AB1689_24830 [Thermodesulfobacteriota bacterium]